MKRPRAVRTLKFVTALTLLVILSGCMFRRFEYSNVYHPRREMVASPTMLERAYEDVRFQSGDGVKLHGWFFPAATNAPTDPRRAILFCHGNGGNISIRLPYCRTLLAAGASVFVFDYRGYGQSEGKPSEEGTYRDAQAAHAWLKQKGFPGEQIAALGESLGGAVATELALREKLGGLILQSTFTSVPDIGAELFPWLPVRWLGSIKYDTCSKLPRVKVPVLVMHSRADGLVKFPHAEKNFAAANEPKFFCEIRGGHSDPVYEQSEFREAIEQFLKTIPGRQNP